jgi:hypothetical protein
MDITTAGSAPAEETRSSSTPPAVSPAGTWTERLLLDRGVYTSTLRFTENGRALILAGPRPGCVGAGSWVHTGPNSFRFRIAELVFQPDGAYVGYVDIDSEAVLDGATFTGSGVSRVYDEEDRLLETAQIQATATRVGPAPGHTGSHDDSHTDTGSTGMTDTTDAPIFGSTTDPASPGDDVAATGELLGLLMGTFVSQATSVAAELGVADAIASGASFVDDIATEVDAHSPSLYRLLRVLADFGVLTELPGKRFDLGRLGSLLRTGVPGSLRGLAVHFGSQFHRAAWSALPYSVRTGEPAFDKVHGAPQFDYYRDHPEEAAIFDGAMTSVAAGIYQTVTSYDFGRFGTVIDVGGGNGACIAAILAAYPTVQGVLFDLPDVVGRSGPVLAAAGVADRCAITGGSFFDTVPGGADVYVLTAVIHDWDDANALRILRNCRAAMKPGARMVIGEPVVPEGPEHSIAKLLDLETLVGTTGRQRTEREFRQLLDAASFRLTTVHRSAGPDCLIEAVPV